MEYLQNQCDQKEVAYEMLVMQAFQTIHGIEELMREGDVYGCDYLANRLHMMSDVIKSAKLDVELAKEAVEHAQRG